MILSPNQELFRGTLIVELLVSSSYLYQTGSLQLLHIKICILTPDDRMRKFPLAAPLSLPAGRSLFTNPVYPSQFVAYRISAGLSSFFFSNQIRKPFAVGTLGLPDLPESDS